MSLEEAIKLIQEIEEDGRNVTTEHIEALKLVIMALKQVIDLVQEYADKETPEKTCDEDSECWGIEATTLLGKIADILKIDRCEETENE